MIVLYVPCYCNFHCNFTVPVTVKIENIFFGPLFFCIRSIFYNIRAQALVYQNTAWKVSYDGVFSGPYFPVFGLNMEIYSVNLRIQPEYGKIWTRKNSVLGHFSHSEKLCASGRPMSLGSKLLNTLLNLITLSLDLLARWLDSISYIDVNVL